MKFSTYSLKPSNWFFPTSSRYRLEVSAAESEIPKIKDFAYAVCATAGYSMSDINMVKLALEEVCVNIMQHAYQTQGQGKIHLELSVGRFALRVIIIDNGRSFDFNGVKEPDLISYVNNAKRGGLGLWFLRKTMAKVHYQAYEDHNRWVLYYRPSYSEDVETTKAWDLTSVRFILASFVLFSFLIFLVYALCSLVVIPAVGLNTAISARVAEGFHTSWGKCILLLYGMGLFGFFLVFYKLYRPAKGEGRSAHPSVKSQGEYSRLLSVINDMEDRLKASDDRFGELEKNRQELRESESARRAMESKVRESEQKLHDLEEAAHHQGNGDEAYRQEISKLSSLKESLDEELRQAKAKIEKQASEHQGIQKEVQVAQQIQHALLPKEYPQIEGFQVGSSYRAASEVGGDYYDFIWVDPTTLGIAVGDVAGKGVPGSIVMAMIRTAMRLEARKSKSPSTVLLKVHQHVNGDMKRGMFATMFYIVLDSRQRSINFASAGHNPMILYRKSTDEVYFLKPKGFPLGIDLPDENLFAKALTTQKISLQKDDLLVIYTDGVTEAMNHQREQFGDERLIQSVRKNAHRSADELVQRLEADIADFVAGAEQSDDVTIVAIKENMQAEEVIFKFRKNLIALVEREGLSIAEACRRMNVSTQTYYYYKEIHDKKGDAGLRPPKKKAPVVKDLSLEQRGAVMEVVKTNPEWGAAKIVEFLKRHDKTPFKWEPKVVSEFLVRKGLGEAKERKLYAANEIDTV